MNYPALDKDAEGSAAREPVTRKQNEKGGPAAGMCHFSRVSGAIRCRPINPALCAEAYRPRLRPPPLPFRAL